MMDRKSLLTATALISCSTSRLLSLGCRISLFLCVLISCPPSLSLLFVLSRSQSFSLYFPFLFLSFSNYLSIFLSLSLSRTSRCHLSLPPSLSISVSLYQTNLYTQYESCVQPQTVTPPRLLPLTSAGRGGECSSH